MLKIEVVLTSSEQRWTLHGRLAGPWVALLQSCWMSTEEERKCRKCLVDLTNLTSVDEEGEEVLRVMMREGAQFCACGVYTKYLLERLARLCGRDRCQS